MSIPVLKYLGFYWILLTLLQGCDGDYRYYRSYSSYRSYYYYYTSGTSSYGSIIGAVISGLIFIGVMAFCFVFCICRRKHRGTNNSSIFGVRFLNSRATHQRAIITANTTPGIYPPQYTSRASHLAPGQTLDPPPNAPHPSYNGSYTPQPPPYGEPAPSYDSMFGPPENKAPPYPTSPNEPTFAPPPAKN